VTRVDFYILAENSAEARLRFACRLTDKATQQRLRVFVLAGSEAEASKLDELLWTFSQNSFIPHRFAWDGTPGPPNEPVIIGCAGRSEPAPAADPVETSWDLMINLTSEVPESFGRYERLAELVDADPGRREHGRVRYRYYRDRGYELKTHQL
jgi:DNA polymerase-3 subunit chi